MHQQDIQAVVNAMWAGGAEAMTIQDQRVISTTGIKCVGNTVILHGVPYSPPYGISAIGDADACGAASGAAPTSGLPPGGRGVAARLGGRGGGRIAAPAYEGSTDMRYAEPAAAETS